MVDFQYVLKNQNLLQDRLPKTNTPCFTSDKRGIMNLAPLIVCLSCPVKDVYRGEYSTRVVSRRALPRLRLRFLVSQMYVDISGPKRLIPPVVHSFIVTLHRHLLRGTGPQEEMPGECKVATDLQCGGPHVWVRRCLEINVADLPWADGVLCCGAYLCMLFCVRCLR